MSGSRAAAGADRGNATVLTAIGGAALLAVLIIALHIAGAVIARHRAEAAADLAALAGAVALQSAAGSAAGAACQQAGRIAAANGGSLRSCEVSGLDLLVVVSVRNAAVPAMGQAEGRARAGPVVSG